MHRDSKERRKQVVFPLPYFEDTGRIVQARRARFKFGESHWPKKKNIRQRVARRKKSRLRG